MTRTYVWISRLLAAGVLSSGAACAKKEEAPAAPAKNEPTQQAGVAPAAEPEAAAPAAAAEPAPSANPLEDAKKRRAEAKTLADMLGAYSSAWSAVEKCKPSPDDADACAEDDPAIVLLDEIRSELNTSKWQPDDAAKAAFAKGLRDIVLHHVGSTHKATASLAGSMLSLVELDEDARTRLIGLAQSNPNRMIGSTVWLRLTRTVAEGDAAGVEKMRAAWNEVSLPAKQAEYLGQMVAFPAFQKDAGHVDFLVGIASRKDADPAVRRAAIGGLGTVKSKDGLGKVVAATADLPDGDAVKEYAKSTLAGLGQ